MIRSLRVKNFRRYKDQRFDFQQGINFIEGENNSGKSTVFYAIEYALFGYTGLLRSPAAFLSPGERAVGVELVFTGRDGHDYLLQRMHRLPPKSRSRVEGHFTLKERLAAEPGAEPEERYLLSSDFQDHEETLALKLQELLGISRRAFEIAVHVRQGEVSAILDGDPKLDIVLGVTAALVAGEELRGLALEAEKDAAALPVLEASLERALRDTAGRGQDLDALRKRADAAKARRKAFEQALQVVKRIDQAQEPLGEAAEALEEAAGEAEEATKTAAQSAKRAAERSKKLGSVEKVAERLKERRGADKMLEKEADAATEALEDLQKERAALDRERGDLSGRIARREKLPSGKGARCEACGQVIDQKTFAAELAEWKKQLSSLDDKLSASAGKETKAKAAVKKAEKARSECAVELASLERAAEELEDLAKAAAEDQAEVAKAQKTALKAAADALDELDRARTATEKARQDGEGLDDLAIALKAPAAPKDLEAAQAVLEKLQEEAERLEEARREASAKAKAELKGEAEAAKDLADQIAEREGQAAEAEREQAKLKAQVAARAVRRDAATKLRTLEKAFKELQLQLREKASQALATDALDLYRRLATEKGEMTGLSIDPGRYTVQVTPDDIGDEVPAAAYQGGGHKLLLGLSFKLAVARMIGPCPFLLLDEPTYGLDDSHRKSLLDRLAGLDVSRQMLVITHHPIGTITGRRIAIVREGKLSVCRAQA